MKTLSELKAWQASMSRAVIVIGPNVWGRGKTGAEAYRNARANLGYRRKGWTGARFTFYDAPIEARVSDMGGICYPEKDGAPVELGTHIQK